MKLAICFFALALSGCQFGVSLEGLRATSTETDTQSDRSGGGGGGAEPIDASTSTGNDGAPNENAGADAAIDMGTTSADPGALDANVRDAPGNGSGPRVLDDFDRANGPVTGWSGDLKALSITNMGLRADNDDCTAILLGSGPREAPVDVGVTLRKIPSAAEEMNVVMDAQTSATCDLIEVSYRPGMEQVFISECWNKNWEDLPTHIPRTFHDGDRLSARLDASGLVTVFLNDELIGSQVIPDWASIPHRGSIGIARCMASGAEFDDFWGTP